MTATRDALARLRHPDQPGLPPREGKRYDGTPEFLDGVKPRLIIATSRESPVAEQITEEWSSEIERRAIKLLRQDLTGAVEIQFRGEDWTARSYLTGEAFRSSKR